MMPACPREGQMSVSASLDVLKAGIALQMSHACELAFKTSHPPEAGQSQHYQGGASRAIVDLACAQRHAGHDVLVVTSRTGDGNYGNYPHYLDRLRAEAVPLLVEDSLFNAICGSI